jgi:ribosomal subunit interface protein
MRIAITARHQDISTELRARARALVMRLAKVAARAHNAQVTFGSDHRVATVELKLHILRGAILVGRAEGHDHRSALDLAAARVRRQLDKLPVKRRQSRARRAVRREAS